VVLRDQTGPQFVNAPASYSVSCAAFMLPPPLALGAGIIDNCSGVSTIQTDTTQTRSADSTSCAFSSYTVRRLFIATDGCGNTSTATQLITITDTTGPAFAGVADTLVNCSAIADPMTVNFPLPTARDVCNLQAYPIQFVDRTVTAGGCADNYDLRIRWRATDVCGNASIFTQLVRARDTIAPFLAGVPSNITVDCINLPVAPSLGAGLTAADNCDDLVSVLLNETEFRVQDSTDCAHYFYDLKREWIASDNCGNVRAYTQLIVVQDSTPPIIICHPDIIVPNLPGACYAQANIPIPLAIYDECSASYYQARLRDTLAIVNTSGLPNNNAVVDTMHFMLSAPNYSDTWPANTQATLVLTLTKADAEQPDEHYKVYGENNTFLGITSPTSSQCGNGITTLFISQPRLNAWLMDGNLELTLIPNGTGATAINAICAGGGSVAADVQYAYVKPNIPLTVDYKINQQAALPFPPSGNIQLPGGMSQITYGVTDCAGNRSECVLNLNILDVEGPSFTPKDTIKAWATATDCSGMVMIPAPTAYTDNCTVGTAFNGQSTQQNAIFHSDPNAGNIPNDLLHTFAVPGQNTFGGGMVTLRFLGDNAQPGEFFTIYSERNGIIGNTTLAPIDSQCVAWHQTQLNLHPDSIKVWAADGNISFRAVANNDAGSYSEFIHPCGALNAQMSDGISKWQMLLNYQYVSFPYRIKNTLGSTIASGTILKRVEQVQVAVGNYIVEYDLSDPTTNTTLRTGILTVIDSMPPVAICKNSLVPIDIGGNGNFTLTPAQINQNSTDNCGIVSMMLSQTQFTCSQSGNTFPVTLIVTDAAGLSKNCTATVQIQTSGILPSYLSGVCVNQQLQLYANPQNDPNQTFTYAWSGPNNFISQSANPVIGLATTANEGTYTVTATNISGCSTTASLFVSLVGQPNVPNISKDKPAYCVGDFVTLTTTAYSGNTVTYAWYRGSPGSSTLLGTTTAPQWQIPSASSGSTNYYVIVTVNQCASSPSAPVTVTINAYPTAQVVQNQLMICEGQPITLTATSQGVGMTFQWTGPNFSSQSAQTTVSLAATTTNAGNYQLIVTSNGCASAPATVQVSVQTRPQQPVMAAGSGAVCVGDALILTSTATGVNTYHWVSPLQDTTITTIGQLTSSAQLNLAGNWTLFVSKNGCPSQSAMPLYVAVEAVPVVTAMANTPVCRSAVLQLQAHTGVVGLNYHWSGPSGFETFVEDPITSPNGGTYIVSASTPLAGCIAFDTIEVVAVDNPIITSVASNAPLCATGNSDAQLFAVVFPPSTTDLYAWTGPNGFVSTAPSPILPNVSAASAGQYQLIVTNQYGCSSNINTTTVLTTNAPAIPVLGPTQDLCAGANLEILIQNTAAYQGANVTYIWHTPTNGVVMTQNPSYQKLNTTTNDAGIYWVEVMNGNCISLPSAQINLIVKPVPTTPVLSSNSPICEGDTLQFLSNITAGSAWQWSGPGGFSASVSNPIITQVVSALHAGPYQASYMVNGCRSAMSDVLLISINDRPSTPAIMPASAVCVDLQSATLNLVLANGSATPQASYQWYYTLGNQPIDMPVFTTMTTIDSLGQFGPGQQSFYVVAQLDGCRSLPSAPVEVTFDTIPNQTAFAGADFGACDQSPILLQANPQQTGTGTWNQSAGTTLIINTPTQSLTSVQGAVAGQQYSFVWSLSNGGCMHYSRDTVRVSVMAYEFAQSEPIIDSCFAFQARLHANQPMSGMMAGYWTQPPNQTLLDVVIDNPGDPNTLIMGIEPGNVYYFFWNLPDIGCGIAIDTTILRSIGTEALAGTDQTICAQDSCHQLFASPLANFETGFWTCPDPKVQINSPASPYAKVCNLQPGNNQLIWITNNGRCGDRSVDTILLRFEPQPVLANDTIQVPYGDQVIIEVLRNDQLPSNYAEAQLTDPQNGDLERINDGIYIFKPALDATGIDYFAYKVCNVYCADSCPQAVVILDVRPPSECIIPTVFTPNGDKVNDQFFLSCLETDQFPDNAVTVFNSNGDVVFYASPYENNWDGTGENGHDLTAGTYFVIVKYNGAEKAKSGFLEIRR
jgi:gliding motility-associated-like protein